VPKLIVRQRLGYSAQNYYTHYLLPEMQQHEKAVNSALVRTLADGTKRVTKKSLRRKYGADKFAIAEQSSRHVDALARYRNEVVKKSEPISHYQLAEIAGIDIPRFDRLLETALSIPPGNEHATVYEKAIESLLSALFYPSLAHPRKQEEIHEGRKRIDITYENCARNGFFNWLAIHYPSAKIFVECKNYSKDVANPELDQLSGRFGPSRGKFGILICRSVMNEKLLIERCVDTAKDDRGYVVHLTDADLKTLVTDYIDSNGSSDFPLLRARFNALIN
jgi:hypothetical protein